MAVVANSTGSLNVGECSAHYSCWQRGDGGGGGADDVERQKVVTLAVMTLLLAKYD